MFSRIYQSARSLVYNPQTKSKKFSPSAKRVMVTTNPKHTPLEDEEDLNDDNTIHVYVPTPSSSNRRKRTEVELSDSEGSKVVTPSPKKRKVLPVRIKEGDEELLSNSRPVVEIPSRTMTSETKSASVIAQSSTKKVHRRFDSEDHVEDFFSTAREQAVADENNDNESAEEEEEDSDNDAPEAVGLQEAAQTVKSREQDAAQAVKNAKEAAREKRKERDEALRKQSEAAKKRKPKAEAQKVVTTIESDSDEAEDEAHTKLTSNSRGLPDLLPLKFLEDDDESNEVPPQESTKRVSNKVRFKDLSEKGPKDKRLGGTTYRVTKKQSTNLAPKASHNARTVKDAWISGRSGRIDTASRMPVSKGFFKK